MAGIDNIVDVTITRQTLSPQMESFDGILLVQEFLVSSVTPVFSADERIREYGSLAEVSAAGFATTSFIYQAASKIFSQADTVDRIYVGRKKTGLDGTETWTEALTALGADATYGTLWYGLAVATRTYADQQLVAAWVQANEKLCVLASDDDNILATGTTTTIADYLVTNSYDRSGVFYSPNIDASDYSNDDCPDAAWLGKLFPKDPGSATWAYKTLAGVSAYALTTSQQTQALARKANIYLSVASVSITQFGTVGTGEYFDVMHGIDWLKARIQNLVYAAIVALDKIPFTDSGVQVIVNKLNQALQEGVDVGLLAADSIYITYPLVADVSSADKSARTLPDVTFSATLAGAIHKTEIAGTVSV